MPRCPWPKSDLDIAYHDTEWGVPSHDDRHLFEALTLGGAQAGLSWSTILKKRDAYRAAYRQFDPSKVARFTDKDVARLLADEGIVRNRLKVQASIINAQACLRVQEELGSLDALLWKFVDGKPIVNHWQELKQLPATSPQSDAMSKELRQRGFKFVGSTICYAVMQAVGLINDHLITCERHGQVSGLVAPRRQ